jgi:hypothetical protein
MKSIISIFVCLIIEIASLHAQGQLVIASDSIRLKNGEWFATSIASCDKKAAYFSDGRVAMLSVISEITTSSETLATQLAELLPGCVLSSADSRWKLHLDSASILSIEPKENRFFAGTSVLLNFISTRAGNFEAVLHFDPALANWLVLELSGSCGWSSTNGIRDIVGPQAVFQSVIEYEAYQFSLGVGVQHSFWTGRAELTASIGKRSLSSSATTGAGSTVQLAHSLEDVSFVTLRYVHLIRNTPFLLSAGGRYYVSILAIDGVTQRFGASVGVGLTL